MPTKILTCSCKDDYQDEQYGKGNRVHNEGPKTWRCSACGTTKSK